MCARDNLTILSQKVIIATYPLFYPFNQIREFGYPIDLSSSNQTSKVDILNHVVEDILISFLLPSNQTPPNSSVVEDDIL
jgi:hypothetical protein